MEERVAPARALSMSQEVLPAKVHRTLRHPHNMQKHFRPFLKRQLQHLQQFRHSMRKARREPQPPDAITEASEDFDNIYRYIQEIKPSAWTLSQWVELLQLKQAPEMDYFTRYEGLPEELENHSPNKSNFTLSNSKPHFQDFRLR